MLKFSFAYLRYILFTILFPAAIEYRSADADCINIIGWKKMVNCFQRFLYPIQTVNNCYIQTAIYCRSALFSVFIPGGIMQLYRTCAFHKAKVPLYLIHYLTTIHYEP